MLEIDIDEIREVNYPHPSTPGERNSVEVVFRNGDRRTYEGQESEEVLQILKHWTPPTA